MSVIVSVRGGEVPDKLKKYAETKADRLIEEYPKITSVRVTLDTQKARCKAEMVVRGKNIDMESDHEAFDFYESIDTALEKIGLQLGKYFDKMYDHKSNHKIPAKEMEAEE